ncbi:MAG TPA: TetR/AcrR family transcriptional regulator [Gemmatimonadaceae bacterium]|jgi:AcrR family transcriptional regulator|nr:TetR/AcrR family transcriptional regulator [Gemmatimonadaceae bacterium]
MTASSYHHGNLRDALINAALELEPEHGPLGVSLREVSRKVGVTHAAAYHHFESKDSLVVAVSEKGFASLIGELDAELARDADGFFSLIGIGVAYVRFAMRSPSMFRFMYATSPASPSPLEQRHLDVLARFRIVADRAIDDELVKRGQAERAAAQFWSTVHGLASLVTSGALDGAPRSKATKRTAKQRERRALDLVRATVVGMLFGTKPPDSNWRPKPPTSGRATRVS